MGRSVTVNWSASTLSSGGAVDGYVVKRYHAGTDALQTILSACTGTVSATSCVESSVPVGSWKYTVTPVFANWQGAESAKSSTILTYDETTPPVNTISLTDHGGDAYLSGTNIFYNKTVAGQFTLTNAATDAGSGPASSQTGALTGTTTGWTHTPSTVAAPAGGPYVSNVFGWAINTTSTPGIVVTGRDTAGNTAQTTLTTTQDDTPPTAGSITYTNTWTTGRSVVLTLDATPSADSGSGVASRQVQRASVPLVGGACTGTYTYSDLGPVNPSTTYTDTWVSNGNCYKYRYVVTDNVGNQATTTSGSVAMVDYAAGGSTSNVTETGIAAPYWVRLTRTGNEFNAERSSNGTTWTQVGAGSTNTVTMGSTLYVGLPVTSHLDGTLNTATFDNVTLTTPPTAVADSYSVNQDNTLTVNASGVLTNDTDPEGNPVTASLVSNVTNGVLSLNANGSFTYTPNASYAGADSFTYRVSDGVFNSNTVTVSLTVNDVNPANDAPVNSVPAAQTTTMNTAKVFSSGNGNLISISDPDAAANPVQAQLVSTNGTTTLSGVTGLSFSAGDGTADATMTFTGTVSAINTALAGLSFNPTTSFTGSASLQIITNDQGNTGTGSALTDNDTVTITVNASSCGTQLLGNPGFENGATTTPWTLNASAAVANSGTPAARTGSWKAVLGITNDDVDTLKQQVTIPAGCTASFSFWLDIDTNEDNDAAYDTLAVAVRNSADTSTLATLVNLSNLNASGGYVQRTYDLSAYAGQTITLRFTATMDYSVSTGFHLDDTSLTTS